MGGGSGWAVNVVTAAAVRAHTIDAGRQAIVAAAGLQVSVYGRLLAELVDSRGVLVVWRRGVESRGVVDLSTA